MEEKTKRLRPFMPVAPGGMLKDELEARGISAEQFAVSIDMTLDELDKLFEGKIRLDAYIASKLEEQLGLPASFWLAVQADYEDDVSYHARRKRRAKNLALWRKLPFWYKRNLHDMWCC